MRLNHKPLIIKSHMLISTAVINLFLTKALTHLLKHFYTHLICQIHTFRCLSATFPPLCIPNFHFLSCLFFSCGLLCLSPACPCCLSLCLWPFLCPPLLWWVCKNSLQRTGPGCTLRYTMAQSLRPCQMGIGKERQ